VDPRGFEPLTS